MEQGEMKNDLIPLAKKFGDTVNLLSVRGNVTESDMPRFFRRLEMGVFDEKDLEFRTRELIHFLKETALTEKFDIHKLIALGYSNGANIAASTLALFPDFLAGAILLRPMRPYKQLEIHKIPNQTNVFIASGKFDPLFSSEKSKAYADFLKHAGNTVDYNLLETGHNLTNEDITLAVDWYKRVFQ